MQPAASNDITASGASRAVTCIRSRSPIKLLRLVRFPRQSVRFNRPRGIGGVVVRAGPRPGVPVLAVPLWDDLRSWLVMGTDAASGRTPKMAGSDDYMMRQNG